MRLRKNFTPPWLYLLLSALGMITTQKGMMIIPMHCYILLPHMRTSLNKIFFCVLSLCTNTLTVLTIQLANLTYNIRAHTCTHICTCVCVYICMFIHVFVCLSPGPYTQGSAVRSSRGKIHQDPRTVYDTSSTTPVFASFLS